MSSIRRNPRFFTDVVRRRRAPGEYVDGTFVPGAVTEATIRASVQPVGEGYVQGGDMIRRPIEGERTRDAVMVITDEDLQSGNETDGIPPDRIVHLGEEYEVTNVNRYSMLQMPHIEAWAERADREGVAPAESPL